MPISQLVLVLAMDRSMTVHLDNLHQLVSGKQLNRFKMVAFDLDGTLLNNDHQLSAFTIASIKRIAERGMLVLLATARMTSAIKNHLEKLGTPGLVVSHNGALVKDVRTGQVYHHETIPKNLKAKLLDLLEERETVMHFNFDNEIYLTANF
jgi:hydroxymethylpyrimidine pyrophosphatase-like HAD family hydrolase